MSIFMDVLRDIALALGAALLLRAFVFTLIVVKGSSMRDTLSNGDRLLATKLELLLRPPKRGSVIICRYPGSGRRCYIKRLIGLPGDEIELVNGALLINGVPQREDYVVHASRRSMPPVRLDAGEYFVMGDNRANSRDSRAIGPISRRQIVAVARIRLWPRGKRIISISQPQPENSVQPGDIDAH